VTNVSKTKLAGADRNESCSSTIRFGPDRFGACSAASPAIYDPHAAVGVGFLLFSEHIRILLPRREPRGQVQRQP
jgi:hypothetical protein